MCTLPGLPHSRLLLKMVCCATGELIDRDGNVTATGDGDLELPSLDHDTDVSKLEMVVAPCSDGGEPDRRLAAYMKRFGTPALRRVVSAFIAELKTM